MPSYVLLFILYTAPLLVFALAIPTVDTTYLSALLTGKSLLQLKFSEWKMPIYDLPLDIPKIFYFPCHHHKVKAIISYAFIMNSNITYNC